MRIIATADLHYDILRSQAPAEALARDMCRAGGDVLLIVGDSASVDLADFDRALALFDAFKGPRLLVAGNHELWTPDGQSSLHRYEIELPQACSRNGFHFLDAAPFVAGGVAFVGSVGWYDYSFRPSQLQVPLRFYRHKIGPAGAARLSTHRHLLEPDDDVAPAARDISTRWMDGEHVKLPFGDVDFTRRTVDRLREQIAAVHDRADRVVAAVHHLPFAELVPHSILPNWEFATAFLGSELLGETLLDFPKLTHAFCGHSHRYTQVRRRHLLCTNIGSTYREKRYEVLDV